MLLKKKLETQIEGVSNTILGVTKASQHSNSSESEGYSTGIPFFPSDINPETLEVQEDNEGESSQKEIEQNQFSSVNRNEKPKFNALELFEAFQKLPPAEKVVFRNKDVQENFITCTNYHFDNDINDESLFIYN